MSNEYRNNHYVPEWYQKRFLPLGQKNQELFYLDLKPGVFFDNRGVSHPKRTIHKQGFKHCFAEIDLYTTKFGNNESTEIEKLFFGAIDNNGRRAVDYFADFTHPSVNEPAFRNLLMYMSTQKLRTPKGLNWLSNQTLTTDRNLVLRFMLRLRQIYCAIWTESVWLIADASRSETKFIISDHPVTVYNRRCGPRSQWCRDYNDPDITFHGTHTIFPLSLEKILILTNLSWVRNPYQSEVKPRPNSSLFRNTIFNFMSIQTHRHLTEQEVCEINFIIKSRAFQYIAASKKEWLFPEKHVTKSDWNRYGLGYLLMPDPRSVDYSTEIIIGNGDGTASGFDEYGRRPWQEGYSGNQGTRDDWKTFLHFQGEFARLFGPYRRGRAFNSMHLDEEKDDDGFHQYHLNLEKKKNSRRLG